MTIDPIERMPRSSTALEAIYTFLHFAWGLATVLRRRESGVSDYRVWRLFALCPVDAISLCLKAQGLQLRLEAEA